MNSSKRWLSSTQPGSKHGDLTMKRNCPTPTTYYPWTGVLRASEAMEWTKQALTSDSVKASRAQNCFGKLNRKLPTDLFGPFEFVSLTDSLRTDVHNKNLFE